MIVIGFDVGYFELADRRRWGRGIAMNVHRPTRAASWSGMVCGADAVAETTLSRNPSLAHPACANTGRARKTTSPTPTGLAPTSHFCEL